jgi:transcriptional regulator GlxA family with amidase domain
VLNLLREPADARLSRLEVYIRQHLGAQLQLEDLARYVGMAPRALRAHCRRTLGLSPIAWVREIRLQAARQQLEVDAGRCVAQVAWACGFSHPGRFSAYYRHRFGTLPSEIAHGELERQNI